MKQLDDIVEQFGTSKPIFEAKIDDDGSCVEFALKERYRPDKSDYDDPIAKSLVEKYHETLNKDKGHFVKTIDTNSVYSNLVEAVISFYEEHAPLKNPKQSRLYKWLITMNNRYYHQEACEGFINLYRYIHKSTVTDTDVINVLAILELMREKYEGK